MKREKEKCELSNDDYKAWDTRDEITLGPAACLCLNIQPYRNDYPPDVKARIHTMEVSILEAIKNGELEEISAGPKLSIPALREWTQDKGLNPAAFSPGKRKVLPFSYSSDYRTIKLLNGQFFHPTKQQAKVIEILSEAFRFSDCNEVSSDYIFKEMQTHRSETNLKKAIFKRANFLYDALIESPAKGIYRIKVNR